MDLNEVSLSEISSSIWGIISFVTKVLAIFMESTLIYSLSNASKAIIFEGHFSPVDVSLYR